MKMKTPKLGFEKLTKGKARIIAHLIGDGCHFKVKSNYIMKYEVADNESLESFDKDMIETYGLATLRGVNPSGKTKKLIPYVLLRSKLVFEDLLKYSTYSSVNWELGESFMNSKIEIKREFLKSLFDDEGTVIKAKYIKEVRLYSINLKGLKQIQKILTEFNINVHKIYYGYGSKRNVYGMIIREINKFNQEIGFNLKRKQDKLNSLLI